MNKVFRTKQLSICRTATFLTNICSTNIQSRKELLGDNRCNRDGHIHIEGFGTSNGKEQKDRRNWTKTLGHRTVVMTMLVALVFVGCGRYEGPDKMIRDGGPVNMWERGGEIVTNIGTYSIKGNELYYTGYVYDKKKKEISMVIDKYVKNPNGIRYSDDCATTWIIVGRRAHFDRQAESDRKYLDGYDTWTRYVVKRGSATWDIVNQEVKEHVNGEEQHLLFPMNGYICKR